MGPEIGKANDYPRDANDGAVILIDVPRKERVHSKFSGIVGYDAGSRQLVHLSCTTGPAEAPGQFAGTIEMKSIHRGRRLSAVALVLAATLGMFGGGMAFRASRGDDRRSGDQGHGRSGAWGSWSRRCRAVIPARLFLCAYAHFKASGDESEPVRQDGDPARQTTGRSAERKSSAQGNLRGRRFACCCFASWGPERFRNELATLQRWFQEHQKQEWGFRVHRTNKKGTFPRLSMRRWRFGRSIASGFKLDSIDAVIERVIQYVLVVQDPSGGWPYKGDRSPRQHGWSRSTRRPDGRADNGGGEHLVDRRGRARGVGKHHGRGRGAEYRGDAESRQTLQRGGVNRAPSEVEDRRHSPLEFGQGRQSLA